jgi:hypothetical protein
MRRTCTHAARRIVRRLGKGVCATGARCVYRGAIGLFLSRRGGGAAGAAGAAADGAAIDTDGRFRQPGFLRKSGDVGVGIGVQRLLQGGEAGLLL